MPQANLPRIILIIPVYNDKTRLEKCLNALALQDYDMSRVAVRVVDNNSSVDIASLVANYPFASYWFEEKPGSYAARNKALQELDCELVAFTDSDCIPKPEWLTQASAALAQSNADAVGGKVELFAESDSPSLAEYYDLVTGFDQQGYIEKDGFSVTANLMVKRDVLEQVGPFNSELMSSGDKEWSRRMVAAGFCLQYCDSAVVLHPARKTTQSIKTKLRRLMGGFFYHHQQHEPQAIFTLAGMCAGLLPPFLNIKKMQASALPLSAWTRVKLVAYFYYLKLYAWAYRLQLLLGLIKTNERL